jgi:enoyl-CoA hydratase/carnithine racemase
MRFRESFAPSHTLIGGDGPVSVELRDDVVVVRLNRPERRNALTREARQELTAALLDLADATDVRALVLASREAGFSSGQDLAEAADFAPADIGAWIDEHMGLYRALLAYPRPLVAAIDGCCVGAGLQMALLCDLRLATPRSFVAMPEIDDAIPCILGVWTLWDVIGRARTTDMVLTNRHVHADEALDWGLISRVVEADALTEAAVELARTLADKPALAFRLTKERLRVVTTEGADALALHAEHAHAIAFGSGQPKQAMREFLDHGRAAG